MDKMVNHFLGAGCSCHYGSFDFKYVEGISYYYLNS